MDLKKALGDLYKEDMTFEDVEKALKNMDLVEKSTFDDYVSKEKYDKACTDASDWKKKYRTTLDESQQKELADKEQNEIRDSELESLKREVSVSKLTSRHITMGYEEKMASEIANAMYEGDTEKICALQSSFIEQTRKEVKKQKQDQTPPPPAAGNYEGDGIITKDMYKKMSLTEKAQLADSDPDTYEKLNKEE